MPELMLKGGPVMYPLLICSFISLIVIIERALFWWRKSRSRDKAQVVHILELAEKGDYEGTQGIAPDSRCSMVRILKSGIAHRDYSLVDALMMAISEESKDMRRYLGLLDTMVSLAPLLGIFGTVTGIIHSFDFLGVAGVLSPQEVSKGIAEALITTAAGLAIAIPSLIFYNFYQGKMDQWVEEMEGSATNLMIVWEKHKNKKNQ